MHEGLGKGEENRASINISISTFVPKPMTPFQWSSQMPKEQIEDCLRTFRERLKKPGLRMKWNSPGNSIFEAVFARGDRRLGAALKRAWELGARFDGWSDHSKRRSGIALLRKPDSVQPFMPSAAGTPMKFSLGSSLLRCVARVSVERI